MKIVVAPTYTAMSEMAAADAMRLMHGSKKLICVASGDTPSGFYAQIVEKVNKGEWNIDDWKFVGLDEWAGMNGSDEGSCRFHLDRQFFQPLNIHVSRICFFDGRSHDPEQECAAAEAFILENGGISLAILGLGQNGHIGMNEPGTPITTRAHFAKIDETTQKTGQKYFSSPRRITHGITLGLANLMEAENIYLLANGAHKAEVVKKMMEQEISEDLPATLLRRHPSLTVYLDSDAAKWINA